MPIPRPPPNSFANMKMMSTFAAVVGQNLVAKNPPVTYSPTPASTLTTDKTSQIAGADAALAALQSSLATESMRKAENT